MREVYLTSREMLPILHLVESTWAGSITIDEVPDLLLPFLYLLWYTRTVFGPDIFNISLCPLDSRILNQFIILNYIADPPDILIFNLELELLPAIDIFLQEIFERFILLGHALVLLVDHVLWSSDTLRGGLGPVKSGEPVFLVSYFSLHLDIDLEYWQPEQGPDHV